MTKCNLPRKAYNLLKALQWEREVWGARAVLDRAGQDKVDWLWLCWEWLWTLRGHRRVRLQGAGAGSSCRAAAHRGQGGSTSRWLPLSCGTAGVETSHVQRAVVFHAFFSTGKASPQASRVPKLLQRFSRHESAPKGDERGVDHLLNPLRLT